MQAALLRQKEQLEEILQQGGVVFFGGAGVSTESGIPDFRSQDGLYHQKYKIAPETILSHDYFMRHTKEFYDFYRDKMLFLSAKPNAAHLRLAALEKQGLLTAVVTQNIDGLHTAAGSKTVYELHGSVHRNYCMRCHKEYSVQEIVNSTGIPHCSCGGVIKPDVVLYGESLLSLTVENALRSIANARTLLVAGTSLRVYPAAGMADLFHGEHLVLINRDETPMDARAQLCIHASVGEMLAP